MKKIIIVMLSVLLVMFLFGCDGAGAGTGDTADSGDTAADGDTTGDGEATIEESLLVPEFYNPSFGSRAIEFPTLSEDDNINEPIYLSHGPALVRFSEDENHTSGDTISSTFMGVSVTVETSKLGDNIEYSVYDNDDSVKIDMVYNTVTRKLNYNQTTITHFAANATSDGSEETTQVCFVEMDDVTVNTDLSLHSDYTFITYEKYTSGNCTVRGSQSAEFYSSLTVNGIAYSGLQGNMNPVEDIRPVDEATTITNSAALKTACETIFDTFTAVSSCGGVWYENGVFNAEGAANVAAMSALLPWTSILSDIAP